MIPKGTLTVAVCPGTLFQRNCDAKYDQTLLFWLLGFFYLGKTAKVREQRGVRMMNPLVWKAP